jgi:hypothetical protein
LRGIDYVFVVNPSKASVYSEFVQTRLTPPENLAADRAAEFLNAHNVTAVSTRKAVLKAKNEGNQNGLKGSVSFYFFLVMLSCSSFFSSKSEIHLLMHRRDLAVQNINVTAPFIAYDRQSAALSLAKL